MKNPTFKNLQFAIALIFVLIGVTARLIPHAPNFTPVSAIALFAGAYLSRKTAFALPVLAMLISDVFIGFYDFRIMLAVYGSFILSVILGFWLKKHKNPHAILAGSILSSALFFLITNFAVWAFSPWYAKTIYGLIQSYIMALPFFRNTFLGDLFYTTVFFSAYELAAIYIKKRFKAKAAVVI